MTVEKAIFERHIRPLTPVPTGVAPRLEGMQNFRAMLFDVYGTLLISGSGDIGISREQPAKADDLQDLLRRYHIDRTPDGLSAALHRAIEQEHEKARRRGIDFPEVLHPDILTIMSKEAYDKFIPDVAKNGIILYDEDLVEKNQELPKSLKSYSIPATRLAEELGKKITANIIESDRPRPSTTSGFILIHLF